MSTRSSSRASRSRLPSLSSSPRWALQQGERACVRSCDETFDLSVDPRLRLIAESALVSHELTKARRHAVLGDGRPGDRIHLFKVVLRTARDSTVNQLFGCPPAEGRDHGVVEVLLVVKRAILLAEECETHRVPARIDRDVLRVLVVLAQLGADDMARLVVRDLLRTEPRASRPLPRGSCLS
jgi:hypothetical protein